MSYLPINQYNALYAKYLKHRSVGELVDIAGGIEGKVVWDLCCGGGEIADICFMRHAARVVAVDGSLDMIKEFAARKFNPDKVFCYIIDISTFLRAKDNEELVFEVKDKPDVVFCRQAVNYWLNEHTMSSLAMRMPRGSVFVFNTFNMKPSDVPVMKSYSFDGYDFCEVSWLLGNMVHHVQIRNGMDSHSTEFRWIDQEEYQAILGKWFDIEKRDDGHTSIYKCVRK